MTDKPSSQEERRKRYGSIYDRANFNTLPGGLNRLRNDENITTINNPLHPELNRLQAIFDKERAIFTVMHEALSVIAVNHNTICPHMIATEALFKVRDVMEGRS